jgi:hypothetical protein
LPDFKTGEIAPSRLSKPLCVSPINLFSKRSKGFDLAGFEKLMKIQELFAHNDYEPVNSI